MDLFNADITGQMGFRLLRLEVYNWGTFDKHIWSLDIDGDTALLTGDVGSGKSTLVDSIITLLVPPKKVTYNKAADASAKERNLASYVRGYYGQKRSESGAGTPEALRNRNQYSVILAVFGDQNIGARVTLAQVFWFKDDTNYPARFYVVSDRTMSIEKDFTDFGSEIKSLRKRLMADSLTKVYDDYTQYSREFRRRFGIRSAQSMELFQQTISMKKVDALTGFVRQNMLEPPDTAKDVEVLLSHFHDLDEAHEAVVRARQQQELLTPLVDVGNRYFEDLDKGHKLDIMEDMLPVWFAQNEYKLRSTDAEKLTKNLSELKAELQKIEAEQTTNEESFNDVTLQLFQKGGQELSILEKELVNDKQNLERRQQDRTEYEKRTKLIGVTPAQDEDEFTEQQNGLADLGKKEKAKELQLSEERLEQESELKALRNSIHSTEEELKSLKNRKSSIPAEYIKLRHDLCKSIDLAEDELPFVGELLQVQEEDAEWEGALERLLHGFGISLLIPKYRYNQIITWMEKHSLKQRLVYYSAETDEFPVDFEDLPEEAACRKLMIRHDSKYFGWLTAELKQRFNHVCCESINDFKKEKFAITKGGQVKLGGKRHEKDDRFDINDRRRYVLGFSNLKKIGALEAELEDLKTEEKRIQREITKLKTNRKQCLERQQAIELLKETKEFSYIDVAGLEALINLKERKMDELRDQNSAFKELEITKHKLMQEKLKLVQRYNELRDAVTRGEDRLKNHDNRLADAKAKMENADPAIFAEAAPLIEQYSAVVFNEDTLRLDNQNKLFNDFQRYISKEKTTVSEQREEKGRQLAERMQEFRLKFPEISNDLGSEPAALGDYSQILSKLELDDLPKFEDRFKHLLRENTIRQLALFREKLNGVCDRIVERIELINESLAQIDYNDGRYIQLEADLVVDTEIRAFRDQLRECTDGAGAEDYSEERFQKVQEIISRFKGRPESAESDIRWRDRVIDVRNWFSFAASEKWRDGNEEYEHYTDSGGKSGGQKEKLAYTILAASLVYNFGLEGKAPDGSDQLRTFRFVVIDEAFLKSSDESARFGLELFKKLDLQLLVVTPLAKIGTIEPYVKHVGFVYQDDQQHRSYLRNLTIKELGSEREAYENAQDVAGNI